MLLTALISRAVIASIATGNKYWFLGLDDFRIGKVCTVSSLMCAFINYYPIGQNHRNHYVCLHLESYWRIFKHF